MLEAQPERVSCIEVTARATEPDAKSSKHLLKRIALVMAVRAVSEPPSPRDSPMPAQRRSSTTIHTAELASPRLHDRIGPRAGMRFLAVKGAGSRRSTATPISAPA